MKSVAFLRNTWKKREPKSPDIPVSALSPQISQKSGSKTALGRSLVVTVKHLPIEQSSASQVDGSWHTSEHYRPPFLFHDQSTQHRGNQGIVRRESSQSELNATYRAHADPAFHKTDSSRSSTFPPPSPVSRASDDSYYLAPISPTQSAQTPSSTLLTSYRGKNEAHPSDRQPSAQHQWPPPHSPSLPSFELLPPLDLNYGPGSKLDSLLEGKTCKCVPPTHSRNPSLCPRNKSSDPQPSMSLTRVSAGTYHSPKTAHAVLDLSHDAKQRTLYHSTGSTPHLPYKERARSSANSDASTHSVDSSEVEQFPLSLFPLPPPLIVRKKVPTPLVFRSTFASSAQSSRDSSPVRTPTTPRQGSTSPSLSNVISPTKKSYLGRPPATFSPPPFSPPDSPLPKPPISRESGRNYAQQSVRPLRMAQSHASLRDPLPFPATHRLTSSEPISDQSILPTRRPAKSRPAERPKNIQTYLDAKEQTSNTGVDAHIEWGYAF